MAEDAKRCNRSVHAETTGAGRGGLWPRPGTDSSLISARVIASATNTSTADAKIADHIISHAP